MHIIEFSLHKSTTLDYSYVNTTFSSTGTLSKLSRKPIPFSGEKGKSGTKTWAHISTGLNYCLYSSASANNKALNL